MFQAQSVLSFFLSFDDVLVLVFMFIAIAHLSFILFFL